VEDQHVSVSAIFFYERIILKKIVRRIAAFGAFLEIIPGTDGMLHISEIDHTHVKRVEDYMKLGDRIDVKVLSVDNEGKIRLSRKVLLGADGDKGSEN